MKTSVEITGLRIRAHHGVMAQERKVGNEFEVTVRVYYPWDPDSDSLESTLNYTELVDVVRREMARPSQLIEHVAGRIYRHIMERWPRVSGGRIAVSKLTPPIAAQMVAASVELEW